VGLGLDDVPGAWVRSAVWLLEVLSVGVGLSFELCLGKGVGDDAELERIDCADDNKW
jgi:hypothetical protein